MAGDEWRALTFHTNMYTCEMEAGLLKSTCWALSHRARAARE